jgi:exodeoxyribonuclease-1
VQTFYWHDYETWGVDPSRDRPCQFAGIRTDLDFNIIGEPLVQYCQPPPDLLPHPDACLITGITPQLAQAEGLPENQFIAAIQRELAVPGTCGVGYNSLRFDDEVTRYTLYRNFHDPYAREWQNGNSRWDIIDMVRACRALRPDGIEWPDDEDGKPSFRLERLTAANGIVHAAAHDALSDVYATIAVARLIKSKQPKLFDYLYNLRNKREVLALLNLADKKPVLHISGMFGTERGCAALVMPLAQHPVNANEIICYDLSVDPTELLELDAESIRQCLFVARDALVGERIALKTIRANRCPVVATERLVDDTIARRLKIDREACARHHQQLLGARDLAAKLRDVFVAPEREQIADPERMLYSGGFFSAADRMAMQSVCKADGDALAHHSFVFEDRRLPELLWRYRARNFPETLSADEQEDWREFCHSRLTDPAAGAGIVLDAYRKRLSELEAMPQTEIKKQLLRELGHYADDLMGRVASPAQERRGRSRL